MTINQLLAFVIVFGPLALLAVARHKKSKPTVRISDIPPGREP